jgi:Zn-dependent protease with chaperone function
MSIGLTAVGAIAIGIALRGVEAVRVAPAARAGHFVVLGQRFTYPEINVAAAITLALAALGAIVVYLALRGVLRELAANRRFARSIRARVVGRSGDVCVFEDERPQAFCAGLLRPRVYLSSGAARMLPADELGAVLAHERHHRDRRDPLRIAAGRVLAKALFFMPVLGRLHGGYCATAELAADDAAIRADDGSPSALASALLAFADATHPAGSVGIAPERVDHMLGRHVPSPMPTSSLAAALATSALIGLIAWQAGGAAVARATFDLPLLSTQPCIIMLALIPGLLGAIAARRLRSITS